MEFTFYEATFKTAGKTIEEIKGDYDGGIGQAPSEEEIQDWIKAYDTISGIKVVVMKSPLDDDGYSLVSYDKSDDWKIRDFTYQAEQDPYFGTYIDDREGFLKDWETGDYASMGSLVFKSTDVEISRELKRDESKR